MRKFSGRKVKVLLVERGLRQREFARIVGVSDDVLSKELRGLICIPADRAVRMADLLGVKVEELCEEEVSAQGEGNA